MDLLTLVMAEALLDAGGTVDLSTIQAAVDAATATANSAATDASAARAAASSAASTANTALTATNALQTALTAAAELAARVQWSVWFNGTPDVSELLAMYVAPAACTFPANFAGSVAAAPATPPAASFVLTVAQKSGSADWTPVGTITVSTAGAATFATTGGAAVTVAAGDRLRVTGPATADTTITGFAATLLAAYS